MMNILRRPTRHRLTGSHRRRDRWGAYIVEFALCTPVLFLVIFGCIEIARFMYFRQAIDQAAYEAAREGVITGARVNDVIDTANTMLTAYGVTHSTVTVTPTTIDEDTATVTVTISANFAANSWVTPAFAAVGDTVTSVTLDHENQAYLVPAAAAQDATLNDNDEPLDE